MLAASIRHLFTNLRECHERQHRSDCAGRFGRFFSLTNLGLISISLRELLRVWWPVALIAVGLALFFTPGGKGR